jgi:predicted nucleotide-binding protein
MAPRLFAQLYGKLDGGKWPADNVENILVRDHGVPAEFAKEAATIAKANATFAGLLVPAKTGHWLTLKPDLREQASAAADDEQDVDAEAAAEPERAAARLGGQGAKQTTGQAQAAAPLAGADTEAANRVFISHSKNPAILDQLKTVLEFGRFVPVVAEEEETAAIPVPEKVLTSMRRCGSAVINVSADEAERHEGGRYGINQNVLIEIGAAFALYDRRVVLVVDKRVQLPSNLQGLYRSEYEGDELGWTEGMKLQKALTNFRNR